MYFRYSGFPLCRFPDIVKPYGRARKKQKRKMQETQKKRDKQEMQARRAHSPEHIKAAMVAGFHLFPSRTEKLSPPAPMVLRQAGE